MAVVSWGLSGCGSSGSSSGSGGSTPPPVVAAQAALSGTMLSFPNTLAGSPAAPLTTTLANAGNATLTGITISIGGTNASDFTSTTTCGTTLAAGSSCTISVSFTPASSASFSAILSVADSVAGSPQTEALAGIGVSTADVSFSGKAMAGTEPLIGASVQLYAAGSTGDGSVGTALLTNPLTTDTAGSFLVPSAYTCPTPAAQLYLVARGGKPGPTAPAANPAIVLLTPVGACNRVAPASQVVVNEATTVTAAYALSQFLAAGENLGATSTNTVGLANAAALASVLVNVATGTSPGASFAANGSSATTAARINSVANLLNTCTAASVGCSALFSATTPSGGSAPTDTFGAALNLVRHPAANVGALYGLAGTSSAFTPSLTTAPLDWTLFVNYTGGGMDGPSGVGVDSTGNVWVASYWNVASLFTQLGVPVQAQGITVGGLSASYGLAVDVNNNAWIPNEPNYNQAGGYVSGNSVSVLNESGLSIAGASGFNAGGMDYPTSVAMDTDGSAWVVDNGNSTVTHLSSAGAALSGASGYTTPLFAFPVAGAVDASHNLWVANQTGINVTKVSAGGSAFTNYACCDGASNLAVDQHGNVWVSNYYGDSISEISSAGTVVSTGYTGGGVVHPQGIAIDGAGTVWVTNYRGVSISELAGATAAVPGTALSPAAGLGPDAGLVEPYGIAIDASGNLWVTNFGSNILTEYIGLASPIATPHIGPPTAP
jgi:hypothetical protein